jgi:hypothetical protein
VSPSDCTPAPKGAWARNGRRGESPCLGVFSRSVVSASSLTPHEGIRVTGSTRLSNDLAQRRQQSMPCELERSAEAEARNAEHGRSIGHDERSA